MKAYVRDFGIVTLLVLALVVVWLGTACSAGAPTPHARAGVAQASLITLMRLEQATPISFEATGRLRDRYVPMCGAFAVQRLGRVQLATAAHCVRDMLAIRYIPPSGWGLDTATVQYVSGARDVAFLDVDGRELVPLLMADVPAVGSRVRAFSPVYDETSLGRVDEHYEGGWYETDQTIVYGWSGSPVVDTAGRAVGVVAKCPDTTPGQPCKPGRALVAGLL